MRVFYKTPDYYYDFFISEQWDSIDADLRSLGLPNEPWIDQVVIWQEIHNFNDCEGEVITTVDKYNWKNGFK